jgi:uncharacterized protein with ATP-grasp and redox domains
VDIMLIKPDCIPCILQMTMTLIRKLPLEEAAARDLFADILGIPHFSGRQWMVTSPILIETVMHKITDFLGDPDPFRAERAEMNRRVHDLLPDLRKKVTDSADPMHMAVRLAVVGNTIDFMMPGGTLEIEKSIEQKLSSAINMENYRAFLDQLGRTRRLVYLADNAGEVVLDKLLIETLRDHHDMDIVFVVRRMPTLNDVTLADAKSLALDEVATLMDNGTNGPVPGTVLERCSDELRALVEEADLIISKGGGNFDTLDEDLGKLRRNITFMLLSKCYPYTKRFGVPLFQPILVNAFTG